MHADTAWFYDPKAPPDGFRVEKLQQAGGQRLEQMQRRILRQTQDGNSGGLMRRESQDIGKVDVQSQKTSVLTDADLEQSLIAGAAELFLQTVSASWPASRKRCTAREPRFSSSFHFMRHYCLASPRSVPGSFRRRRQSPPGGRRARAAATEPGSLPWTIRKRESPAATRPRSECLGCMACQSRSGGRPRFDSRDRSSHDSSLASQDINVGAGGQFPGAAHRRNSRGGAGAAVPAHTRDEEGEAKRLLPPTATGGTSPPLARLRPAAISTRSPAHLPAVVGVLLQTPPDQPLQPRWREWLHRHRRRIGGEDRPDQA